MLFGKKNKVRKEYECTCQKCNHMWHYTDLDIREQERLAHELKTPASTGFGATIKSRQAKENIRGQMVDLNRCPNCNSIKVEVKQEKI